ncbi:6-phosphogluconate dehydrogenase C-terminal domain-like protein [Hymenopellis radicata]|nr:6-phosphogluconate dehydrogenase C-terminal domain-like protein [Hymenopellis radicata]
MVTTIAVIAAGAMGSAVARKLVRRRSEATRQRAIAAGMVEASYSSIAKEARFVLSILPPSDAVSFAQKFALVARSVGASLLFADCNAVNPATVKRISEIFHESGMGFVDAGIIGGPPQDGYDPVFYASADDADRLHEFHSLSKCGLKISLLEGEGVGVGDASALKMSYAGITKGTTAIMATMILAAHRSSPATSTALLNELHQSQPVLLNRLGGAIPGMVPKAYRWVGEMEEIAGFVGDGEGEIYEGIAKLYSRVEKSLQEDNADVQVLKEFAEAAKKM